MSAATIEKMTANLPEMSGKLYRYLMLHIPPQEIRDKKTHSIYSEVAHQLAQDLAADLFNAPEEKALRTYFGAIAHFIDEYERAVFPLEDPTPAEMLGFLMEQRGLKQTDLAQELGTQSVVSEVLHGKRDLNTGQIVRLAKKFHVNPDVFLPR